MESTPTERYVVIRKITIAIVIQAVYVCTMFHYIPIPESLSYTVTPTTCCVPTTALRDAYDGHSVPSTGKWADMCVPLAVMNDDSLINKYSEQFTGRQEKTKTNHYTEPIQGQSSEHVTKQYCEGFPGQVSFSLMDRFVYTLRWQMFSASTLLFAIIDVAWRRLYTKALDPINGQAEHLVQVKVRILQNTTEQLVCNLIGQLVLCTYLTEASMKIIPILVSLFVFGRIIFKLGYEESPSRRTYGFAFTYIPTFVTYLYCAWCAI